MHIEFLVEEESAEVALRYLVPKLVGADVSFDIHVYQGKQDLLEKLPARLTGYCRWMPDDWRIVVLVDEDRQDCRELKDRLEKIAGDAGFLTRSKAGHQGKYRVLNRLAIEELEAWFLGDAEAIVKVYPRIPRSFAQRAQHRNPDAIRGGTWEALQRLLQNASYYSAGLPKSEFARSVSAHMDPKRNTSASFRLFKRSLVEMVR